MLLKRKVGKTKKKITQQPKAFEKQNIVDIKSVTLDHPINYPRLKRFSQKVLANVIIALYIVK